MINNFQDFILESQIIQMINESDLMGSSDFISKLKKISKNNKVAKLLTDLFDEEYYVDSQLTQNWIDVTDEADTISFISDNKADKVDSETSSPYIAKGRGTIKIGRFVKALLNNPEIKSDYEVDFKDKDIEEFVNLYKATKVDLNKKFKLVKGAEIADWYDEDKYSSEKGTLGSSCMKDVRKSFFKIYTDNDKVCRLLIYVNNDKELIGRALVWKLHESPCEAKYFMDRVYTANDSDLNKFKEYAEENGWLYKNKMTSTDYEGLQFKYGDENVFGKISVQLTSSKYANYPYVDTLTFLDKKNNMISNVGFKDGFSMDDVSGGLETCNNCDGDGILCHGHCEDGKVECDTCSGEGSVDCESCEGYGAIEDENGKAKDCKDCKGAGRVQCEECDGEGTIPCDSCRPCDSCVGIEEYTKKLLIDRGEGKKFGLK